MPFKSKAQRRKFAELLVKGEISEETFEEWNRETGSAKLPEYAHSKTKRRPSRKKPAKRPRSANGVTGKRSAAKSRTRRVTKTGNKRK